jgi:hypothetical protein
MNNVLRQLQSFDTMLKARRQHMKNSNKNKIIKDGHAIPKPILWIMRRIEESKRRKYARDPQYKDITKAAYDVISKNRERLNKNAGEIELNQGR